MSWNILCIAIIHLIQYTHITLLTSLSKKFNSICMKLAVKYAFSHNIVMDIPTGHVSISYFTVKSPQTLSQHGSCYLFAVLVVQNSV